MGGDQYMSAFGRSFRVSQCDSSLGIFEKRGTQAYVWETVVDSVTCTGSRRRFTDLVVIVPGPTIHPSS